MSQINSEIAKEYGFKAGASIVGIAASRDFNLAPNGFKPTDVLEGCLSVVVFGSPFPQESLAMGTSEYTEIRNAMVERMTNMAKEVAERISADGYKTKAISATGGKYIDGKHYGHISLKHAAELAGLGRINRNYLLTNPQYGNLLWFSAVLTDADLIPDTKAQYQVCNHCNQCVALCPSGALDDLTLFGERKCSKACWKQVNRKWELSCFLCRKVCPYRFGE